VKNSIEFVDQKLFAGPRIRRLRSDLGLTQTRMAEELGVSISYLNLIERNQRPLTAKFLLRLAEVYAVDLRLLSDDAGSGRLADIAEVLSDGLFRGADVPRSEIQDWAANAPGLTDALVKLYAAYRDAREAGISTGGDAREEGEASALAQVRDVIQDRRNHFPELETLAERIAEDLRLADADLFGAIAARLADKHAVTVRVLPVDVLPESLRRFDIHRKQLQLSELLDGPGRTFQSAYQLGLMEARSVIDDIIASTALVDDAAKRILRINLANYFAAALVMPYARLHTAAEQVGYDINILMARFGASFEQVAHRLTTLQRPSARGVPFFLIRVDQAGNVSKRFSAGRFPFAKYGGTCPLWSVHSAFRSPGTILPQIVELPDGARYFSVARTARSYITPWGGTEPVFALALGCELKYARHLVYAKGMNIETPEATPIGINCALCDRDNCRQRSGPPIGKRLIIDERVRGPSPFRFSEK
jgi:XRE family transcriptional regulator, fatty acid utilization regulator